jgi:glycosyltransferase involved in cell wall biosynthesis
MHLAFIDIAYGYTTDRPEQPEPLGGTTSAICFLAQALKQRDVVVTIFNKVTQAQDSGGITCLPLETLPKERTNPIYDAFIFCGRWTDWLVKLIADGTSRPLIAWMHESTFNPHLVPAHQSFNAICFVSAWQQHINKSVLPKHWQQTVIGNAMNPRYENMFAADENICAAKGKPPIAVYVGSTPRGLLHLPQIWPHLYTQHPDWQLQIFCNPTTSANTAENNALRTSFATLPGVSHVGMVGQPELAIRMRQASLFLAPNPYPETSCIALIEAMAAGLQCCVTARGALPETANGFATLTPIMDADHPTRFDQPFNDETFIANALQLMARHDTPEILTTQLHRQRQFFLEHYRWEQRADAWIDFVTKLKN